MADKNIQGKVAISKIEEVALSYFDSNYNCAESVSLAFKHFMGALDFLPKVATPFGAGIGRKGYICGALTAGLICVGYVFGRENEKQDRKLSYKPAGRLLDEFRERFGNIDCSLISKIDWNTNEGIRQYLERVHYEVCHKVVSFVSCWLYKNGIMKI